MYDLGVLSSDEYIRDAADDISNCAVTSTVHRSARGTMKGKELLYLRYNTQVVRPT